jgi:transcriptional regulator with XRE-family HTH domain
MNEAEFRRLLADNLIHYRKRCGMTQAEVAARINYSDKSVSKWERADGSPDVYVLKTIADMYGVSLSDLFAARDAEAPLPEEARPESSALVSARHSPFTVCLAVGCVWLVATVAFSVVNMLPTPMDMSYLAFIYAIPASFAAMELFAALWRLPAILHLLFSSAILWTVALSVHLSVSAIANIYLLYVIAAVAQLLGIFALGLYWQMIHMPRRDWYKKQKKKQSEN